MQTIIMIHVHVYNHKKIDQNESVEFIYNNNVTFMCHNNRNLQLNKTVMELQILKV